MLKHFDVLFGILCCPNNGEEKKNITNNCREHQQTVIDFSFQPMSSSSTHFSGRKTLFAAFSLFFHMVHEAFAIIDLIIIIKANVARSTKQVFAFLGSC
jgi:hypothetical protein